ESLLEEDYLILTSGGYLYQKTIERLRSEGKPIFTDLELACHFYKAPVLAITGSNGKSTTMHLTKSLLEGAGKKVLTAGGDNVDFAQSILAKEPYDYALLELSSIRLQWSTSFRPKVAVYLNLYPGHSDRHDSMKEYGLAKAKIFSQQGPEDLLIHQASPDIRAIVDEVGCRAKIWEFSAYQEIMEGAFYRAKDRSIVFRPGDGSESVFKLEKFPLVGLHNFENLAASTLVAKACEISDGSIQNTIGLMKPLSDRIELLKKINGAPYFSDAKASNTMATLSSLLSFPDHSVVLIAGGEYMKHQLYWMLKDPLARKVKHLIIFGMYRDHFAKHWGGVTDTYLVNNIEEAVEVASRLAGKGDNVLFSPAARPEPAIHMSVPRRSKAFRQAVDKAAELNKARSYLPTRY
ncbi:MAG TPA: UDP-N-acetylmuramoyl-L-alanine--D-glutamate ligase, partial [bacterium]|nr:UDP-N-acetylmuramoyl-L-alanine--D-glutamate ligase [bacterium]